MGSRRMAVQMVDKKWGWSHKTWINHHHVVGVHVGACTEEWHCIGVPSRALSAIVCLTARSLRENKIQDAGAAGLGNGLAKNTALKTLE